MPTSKIGAKRRSWRSGGGSSPAQNGRDRRFYGGPAKTRSELVLLRWLTARHRSEAVFNKRRTRGRRRRGGHSHGPPGLHLRSKESSRAVAVSGAEAKRRTCATISSNPDSDSNLLRRTNARHCTARAASALKASVNPTGVASIVVPRCRKVDRMASVRRSPSNGYSRASRAMS